jgi:hypothetical protein
MPELVIIHCELWIVVGQDATFYAIASQRKEPSRAI